MPLTECLTTDESLLKVIIGTWFPELSRTGLGLDTYFRTEGDQRRHFGPLKFDGGF